MKATKSDVCKRVESESSAFGETNDCAVRAIAIACGLEYKDAHATAAKFGRKPHQGMRRHEVQSAILSTGKSCIRLMCTNHSSTNIPECIAT
jgi:hypothetical protein